MRTNIYEFQIKFLFHISDLLTDYVSTSINLVISIFCLQTVKKMSCDIDFA